jgi:hypothetical protein
MQNMAQISSLDDSQIYEELVRLGYRIGPVTPTTRSLYEKRLANHCKKAIVPGTANTTVSRSPAAANKSLNASRTAVGGKQASSAANRSAIQQRSTNTDFPENKSQQTDPIRVSTSTQVRAHEESIDTSSGRSSGTLKYSRYVDEEPEDEDAAYERRLYGMTRSVATKPASQARPAMSTASSSTQATFPLEFKLLDNPSMPKTQTYISVESIPSEAEQTSRDLRHGLAHDTSADYSGYPRTAPNRDYDSSPRGGGGGHSNYSPSQRHPQKHSFMNTSNFEKLNQNFPSSHNTSGGSNYNEYSYIDTYVSSNQPVNRKKNLLPLNPNTLLNPSNGSASGLYPDLTSYSQPGRGMQQQQHDSRFNAHYAKLYSAPMPADVAATVMPAKVNQASLIELAKDFVAQHWAYLGLFCVLFCIMYFLVFSNENANPIRL